MLRFLVFHLKHGSFSMSQVVSEPTISAIKTSAESQPNDGLAEKRGGLVDIDQRDGIHNPDIELQSGPKIQPRPSEFPNLAAEIVCILICSIGQFFFAFFLGNVEINQLVLVNTFQIPDSSTPWLIGSYLLANGVSVSVCGSLMDLVPPRPFLIGAFAWMSIWTLIGALTVSTSLHLRWAMFLVVRVMQGLSLGALVSGAMSILGRLYTPGLRKTRVFSLMACFPPIGFALGAIQGGALRNHQGWVFGTTGQ